MEKEERDHLLLLVEDSKLLRRFGEEFSIDDGEKAMEEDRTDFQKPKSLFSVVSSSTWFNRAKRTWNTPEYLFNLKELLHLFPSYHQKIRQILKIPKSSFRRMKQEIESENVKEKRVQRFMKSHPELSKEEEIFISKIVEPPTEPMTLDKI